MKRFTPEQIGSPESKQAVEAYAFQDGGPEFAGDWQKKAESIVDNCPQGSALYFDGQKAWLSDSDVICPACNSALVFDQEDLGSGDTIATASFYWKCEGCGAYWPNRAALDQAIAGRN